jgi:plastocyanin domain-containing protein
LNAIVNKIPVAVAAAGLILNLVACQPAENQVPQQTAQDSTNEQLISMDVLKNSFSPNKFTLRKGVPVKWTINVKELDDCNKVIVIPEYGLDIKLQAGVQVIEFTPSESGVIPWSCWMGMIPGTFVVIDNELVP